MKRKTAAAENTGKIKGKHGAESTTPKTTLTPDGHREKTKTDLAKEGLGYPLYSPEAAEWVYRPTIPGAYPPIFYIGEIVSLGIARLLGRSISLEEAQYLVQTDGEPTVCALTGIQFQPVLYLPFVPRDLEFRLKDEGKKLTEIALPFGGAFYVNKENEIVAFSGPVFHYVRRHERYERKSDSPLVSVAEEFGRVRGNDDWGKPYQHALNLQASIKAARERREKVHSLVGGLLSNRPPGARRKSYHGPMPSNPDWNKGALADAFASAENTGQRYNGQHKNANGQKTRPRLKAEKRLRGSEIAKLAEQGDD
ncbi:MAG: hypothetical protein KGI49_02885 [Patescibacteria group bacterium]|nr:hypothetical protein [Patescibacteria group bacterium]